MKKFLCGLVVVSSLAGCVPSQTNETTSVLKNTATQVSKIYINSAKTTVKNACMAKFNNSSNCECMTSSVMNSLDADDVKYLYKKATKKVTADELARDNTIGSKIMAAQVQCMISKLYN